MSEITTDTIRISIAKDFSRTPGHRLVSSGKYSGEDFRQRFLEPHFAEGSKTWGVKLEIDLGGTAGLAPGFLEEAFGGLVRLYPTATFKDRLIFINHEGTDDYIEEINLYMVAEYDRAVTLGKVSSSMSVETNEHNEAVDRITEILTSPDFDTDNKIEQAQAEIFAELERVADQQGFYSQICRSSRLALRTEGFQIALAMDKAADEMLDEEKVKSMTKPEFIAFLHLIHCVDSSIINKEHVNTLRLFADARAVEFGFTDWIDAFHNLK